MPVPRKLTERVLPKIVLFTDRRDRLEVLKRPDLFRIDSVLFQKIFIGRNIYCRTMKNIERPRFSFLFPKCSFFGLQKP